MKTLSGIAALTLLLLAGISAFGQTPDQGPAWKDLKGPGKKNWINASTYFILKPSEKPKMGTTIFRVQVFDKSGKKNQTYTIKGESGMPSMAGAHDSGPKTFSLNKSGNYLLPVDVVMPGEWELKLSFLQDGKTIFRGRFKFDV